MAAASAQFTGRERRRAVLSGDCTGCGGGRDPGTAELGARLGAAEGAGTGEGLRFHDGATLAGALGGGGGGGGAPVPREPPDQPLPAAGAGAGAGADGRGGGIAPTPEGDPPC